MEERKPRGWRFRNSTPDGYRLVLGEELRRRHVSLASDSDLDLRRNYCDRRSTARGRDVGRLREWAHEPRLVVVSGGNVDHRTAHERQ